MPVFGMALMSENFLESHIIPLIKTSLRIVMNIQDNKPEFMTEDFIHRFSDYVSVHHVPVESIPDHPHMVFLRIHISTFANEPFFSELKAFLERLTEVESHGAKLFPVHEYQEEDKIFTFCVNVLPVVRAANMEF